MTDEQIIEFWKDKQAIDIELLINHLPKFIEIIQKQKEELKKKDKVIEEMAKYIESKELMVDKYYNIISSKYIKEYFYKKVEGK